MDSTPEETFESEITFTGSISPESRVTSDLFDNNDQIIVSAYENSTAYATQVIYTYSNSQFTSSDPISYTSEDQELTFYAAYPAVSNFGTTFSFEVLSDQSSGDNLELSDLLLSVPQTTNSTCPTLAFNHVLSSLVINIDSSLAGGVMTMYVIGSTNIDAEAMQYSANGNTMSITPAANGEASYKAIFAPQSISAGDLVATYVINDVTYQWVANNNITFESGYRYTYNWDIYVGDVELDSYIEGWNDEEIDDPEEADPYTWQLVVSDDGDTTGLWIDAVFSSVFMGVPYLEKEVEIYEAVELPGYYRITNVYDAATVATLMGVTSTEIASFVLLGDDGTSVDTIYTYINATDPDNVYFPYQGSGFWYDTTTYGGLYFASYCDLNFDLSSSSYPSTYGKMEDGVITFPAESLYCHLHLYGAWLSTSDHYIYMPGTKLPSNITSINCYNIDHNARTAEFEFFTDELAASIKFTVVDYDATGESYETVADGIKDGSIESSQVDVSQSYGCWVIEMNTEGTFALVAVPYDEDGDAGKFDASTCVAEFRVNSNIAPGVADGSYAVASVVDAYYGNTYSNVEFTLTRSQLSDYDYTSTDFFGLGFDVTYSWVLDPTAMKMYVTPTDCVGYAIDFYSATYYAGTTSEYYAYIGSGDDGYDPWEINIELNDAGDAYVMTTFATDARLGVFDTSSGFYISGYDAVIEAGTAISDYSSASYAPARSYSLTTVNKQTTTTTSSKKATVRTDGTMVSMMK
ncbi:MAG: fimbrillin family protein [Rikenellaceae bacterium]